MWEVQVNNRCQKREPFIFCVLYYKQQPFKIRANH